MSILERIISPFAPHECVGCGAEGLLLCEGCLEGLTPPADRCYKCQKPSPESRTCERCQAGSSLHRVAASTSYTGLAKKILWKLKFDGARMAARLVARNMYSLINSEVGALIVPVPTSTRRVRQRGYDQAQLIARHLSRQTSLSCLTCLARIGQTGQRGATRAQRQQQLAGAFRVTNRLNVTGAHIILVDDVLTTGATLESAAKTLKAAGAARVDAVVFAYA